MHRKNNNKIAIVGIYPPPYGGVGIHIKRLVAAIEKTDLDYVFFNSGQTIIERPRTINSKRSLLKFVIFLLTANYTVIHSHTGRWPIRVLIGLISLLRRKKVLFTAHSYAFCQEFLIGNFIRRFLVKYVLRKSYVIAVNPTIRDEVIKMGVPEKNCWVVPAFIPPPQEVPEDDIPIEVQKFCHDKTPLLCACGAWVRKNGVSTYGLEMFLPMMEDVLQKYPQAGLIVYMGGMLSSNPEINEFQLLQQKLKSSPWKNRVLFYESKQEFYPILNVADVFLRPTFTDGDAVSVREALSLNVPVVASQTHARPQGAQLFEIGNQSAFNHCVLDVLNNIDTYKKQLQQQTHPNSAEQVIGIYKTLLSS
jgi:glycosyltransferase involved in cell wall biosynthesis